MNARVAASSGSPDDRNTSCTIGGTALLPPPLAAAFCMEGRRCSRFFSHSLHCPVSPGAPPHEHLRCSRNEETDAGSDVVVL
jgi:hypothetical protein